MNEVGSKLAVQRLKTLWNSPTTRLLGYRTVECLLSADALCLEVSRVVRQRAEGKLARLRM